VAVKAAWDLLPFTGHGAGGVATVATPEPPRDVAVIPLSVAPGDGRNDVRRRAGQRPRLMTSRPDPGPVSAQLAHQRAADALRRLASDHAPDDPLAPLTHRFAARSGASLPLARVLPSWLTRISDRRLGDVGYPWRLGFDAGPNSPAYDTPAGYGAMWRSSEVDWLDRAPTEYGRRILAPIALAENLGFLLELAADAPTETARGAERLLAEVQLMAEADVADQARGDDPWRDTFAVWALTRQPRAFELLRPIALAVIVRYATMAARVAGFVCANRYPNESQPLVSASAQLGHGLWTSGYRVSLLPGILGHLRETQDADGGWADPGQPTDILTTLAAADLLSTLDPTFDPAATVEYFVRRQEPAGWWRALDPEVPWLTAAVHDWLESVERPFAERFRWPRGGREALDRKTGIAGYAVYAELARALQELPALAVAPVGIAFIDLAGFRDFNNANGQDAGDRALRRFAQALAQLPGALAVRDGGDEFLVVGAPERTGLLTDLEQFAADWPDQFRRAFGDAAAPVAPRILVGQTQGRHLMRAREDLGRRIASLKAQAPSPGPSGIVAFAGDL
jgi:GGDEF domain-containing protein